MRRVDIHDAKTTLSQLVETAETGETVVLARAGKPVVKLGRLAKKHGIRLGGLEGQILVKERHRGAVQLEFRQRTGG